MKKRSVRRRIFEIIEKAEDGDKLSTAYDGIMMVVIITSLVPLMFKQSNPVFDAIDAMAAAIFMGDYLVRWFTADLKLGKGPFSFVIYPLTPMAIIDLLAILPSFGALGGAFRALKVFRLFRTLRVLRAMRVFRVAKMARYSKSIDIILNVIRKQKEPLVAVCVLAVAYILICALVVFNVEPDTFQDFFEAIYWAAVSLTTMGYGDIYPVSTAGRVVTMISSFIGIAVVALPAGIITAGYMSELEKEDKTTPTFSDSDKKESFNMSKKRYYIPGIDNINQMVETPASKERTERNRFIINTVISAVAAVAAIVSLVVSICK